MQIKYQDGNTAHVPTETGRALVAAKLATEVIPEKKKPVPNMQWEVRQGVKYDDFQEPPFIWSHCKTCGHKGTATTKFQGPNTNPTAHLTTQVRHCGVIDLVPTHVGKQFVQMYAEYTKRSRKPPIPQKSVFQPNRTVEGGTNYQFHGIQSREALLAEQRDIVARDLLKKS
jgi:hypothetical protein